VVPSTQSTVVRAGARCAPTAGRGRRTRSHVAVGRPLGRAASTTAVRAGAGAPCSPGRSSHRLTAAGPRGTRDGQPGWGRRTLIAGAVFSRLPASWLRGTRDCYPGGGRCTLITGAVIALQRAAVVSASAIRAGARAPRPPDAGTCSRLHCRTTRPGPAAGAWLRPALGRGRPPAGGAGAAHQPVGPTTTSSPRRRCSQTSWRTPAVRQVRGTDSDTSRRRPRRSRPGVGALATTGPDEATRRGDAAAASCSCRFSRPLRGFAGVCPLRRVTCAPVVHL
jgi:hypothetical protein